MPLVSVTVGQVARVTIDHPPVNALNRAVRAGLLEAVAQLAQASDVRAVVLACAGRTFVSGADIRELGQIPTEPTLPDVLAAIEGAPMPWVAAIRGTALGGGLELAMACHGRVTTPDAKLGLPEVNLGIVPGAGGTVRLPRLVPLPMAIEMVCSGKPIAAAQALDAGLVDMIRDDDLEGAARALALELAGKGAPLATSARPLVAHEPVDWAAEAIRLSRKGRGAVAPSEALEALKAAAAAPVAEALADARERFLRLAGSDQSAALRHIFFAERAAGTQLRAVDAAPADLDTVGVVGGGTMGAGIAVALLLTGAQVRLLERDGSASTTAQGRVEDALAASVGRGVIAQAKADAALAHLTVGADYAALVPCGLVIEAVFEDIEVKRAVFEKLDAVLPDTAILATNTSYLDVNVLAATTKDPSRILGLHFFSPAHVMKLLEVVRADATGPRALATGAALAKRLRKIAVVAGVCDGFIGNRVMAAYRRACEFMLEEGADPQDIDAAMRDFGFAMGLFAVQDMSGLDIAWAQRKAKAASQPVGVRYARIADRLCEAGRFGRKSGGGWYDYVDGKPVPSPHVAQIIAEERSRAGHPQQVFDSADIMARILDVMQREGRAILAEGIADAPGDIDVVMVNGYGFPRHRGGPMFMDPLTPDSSK